MVVKQVWDASVSPWIRMLYLQQLPALGKCSVFITGVNGVKLTQYPHPSGGKLSQLWYFVSSPWLSVTSGTPLAASTKSMLCSFQSSRQNKERRTVTTNGKFSYLFEEWLQVKHSTEWIPPSFLPQSSLSANIPAVNCAFPPLFPAEVSTQAWSRCCVMGHSAHIQTICGGY